MLTVDNLKFILRVKTYYGNTLCVPAMHREDNYNGDGGLSVFFSPFWGIKVKGYSLGVRTWDGGISMDVKSADVDCWGCNGNDECDDTIDVHLTPAQLKKIEATINALAKKAEARVAKAKAKAAKSAKANATAAV